MATARAHQAVEPLDPTPAATAGGVGARAEETSVGAPAADAAFAAWPAATTAQKPAVIAHYHIYKNAGSSVDEAIRSSLGRDALIELDKDPITASETAFNGALVERIHAARPHHIAFACHRFAATAHRSTTLTVLPIVFLRHPLLRIASVYRYGRRLGQTDEAYAMARDLAFPDWLDWYVDHYNGKNYQTCVLSIREDGRHSHLTRIPAHTGDIRLACERLDEVAEITAVGLVERFDEAAARFEARIKPFFPAFTLRGMRANATKPGADWREELNHLMASLPGPLLTRFITANSHDFALYDRYAVLFDRPEPK